ncbi:hypothetical protein EBS02_12400, partial [bacterium]|nr:hypothetical protein [bacterium]
MEMMLLIFFATLSFSFGLSYWATFDKLKKSNLLLAELFIKTRALEELNSQVNNGISMSDDTIHKENFIKFLSDSRDWAFEYIEKSQQTIKEVSDELKVKGLDNYSEKLLALLPEINQEKRQHERNFVINYYRFWMW